MSDSLAGMVVDFAANYEDLTSAGSAIGEVFDRIASTAGETASQISDDFDMSSRAASSFAEMSQMAAENMTAAMEGAAGSFGAITEAATNAGIDIGDGFQVSYEALDELAQVSEETGAKVSESLSSVNFDAFQGALQSLTEAVDSATSQINERLATIPEQAQEDADKSESAFSGFHLGGMINQIGLGIFAFQNMANMAQQLGSALFTPAMNAENVTTALTTLDGSAQKATQEMQALDAFAAKTPFQTLDIDKAAEQLQGFGYNAGSTIPIITAVGDALGSVGKETPAELMSVVDVFGKMKTEGKVTAMMMTELAVHGINAWKALSDASGLSIPKLQEMVKKGLLPANEAIKWLTTGIEKNPLYKGGMAKQSNTLAGIMSTLSSDWDQFMAAIVSPALPMLEQGLSKLTTLLANPQFQAFAKEVGTDIVSGIKTFATWIGNLVSTGEQLSTFFKNNQTALDALIAVLGAAALIITSVLIEAFVAWAAAMLPVMLETLATAAPFILLGIVVAAVIFGIIEAVQHWGQITTWLKNAWNTVVGFFSSILNDITGFFSAHWKLILAILTGPIGLIIYFWKPITGFFKNLGSGIVSIFHDVGNGIAGGIKWAIDGVIGLINDFIGGIDSIGIDVGPVHIHPSIPKIPLLAMGGDVAPGDVAIAGEAGPELVYGGTSGAHVMSRQASAAMMGGASNQPIYVIFQVDGRTIATAVVPHVGQGIINATRSGHPIGEVA